MDYGIQIAGLERKLAACEAMLRAQNAMLTGIRDDLQLMKGHVVPDDDTGIPDHFPTLKTKEELLEFNEKLSERQYLKSVKLQLKLDIDGCINKTVKKVMNRIAEKPVWKLYSLRGQRGKQNFEKQLFRVYELVKTLVVRYKKPTDGRDIFVVIDGALSKYLCENKRKKNQVNNLQVQGDDASE